MLRMKQILLVELISCGAVVKLTQFSERHSIEQLLCPSEEQLYILAG